MCCYTQVSHTSKDLSKSYSQFVHAPLGNIRHPSSRSKMFEEVAQIKVGTVSPEAFAVTEFIRIQSRARPNGDINRAGLRVPVLPNHQHTLKKGA
jgi:hypothetical protein